MDYVHLSTSFNLAIYKDTCIQTFIVFIVLFILTLYFQIQSIMAYINQLNNKTKEVNVSFKDKKVYEKIILLLKEFVSYIIHPVIIK